MVVSQSGKFIRSKSIGDDLKLPHELPDSQAASHLNYTPRRGVRGKIVRAFAQDGWKDASIPGYGMYELRKRSPFRRRLSLLFWVEKCGPSLRSISAMMQLGPERSRLTVMVRVERSARYEYDVPNPDVLSRVLDNMRVVVKYLGGIWTLSSGLAARCASPANLWRTAASGSVPQVVTVHSIHVRHSGPVGLLSDRRAALSRPRGRPKPMSDVAHRHGSRIKLTSRSTVSPFGV